MAVLYGAVDAFSRVHRYNNNIRWCTSTCGGMLVSVVSASGLSHTVRCCLHLRVVGVIRGNVSRSVCVALPIFTRLL